MKGPMALQLIRFLLKRPHSGFIISLSTSCRNYMRSGCQLCRRVSTFMPKIVQIVDIHVYNVWQTSQIWHHNCVYALHCFCLICTVSMIQAVEKLYDLCVTSQGHRRSYLTSRLCSVDMVSYMFPIVTFCLMCIVSMIQSAENNMTSVWPLKVIIGQTWPHHCVVWVWFPIYCPL